ncbi:MAG: acyltransferase [Hyphomicrobiaceae bacterium]|nr:acyltransferase [Hyphomicrobiaceae bacterium]
MQQRGEAVPVVAATEPEGFRAWVKARRHPVARVIYGGGLLVRNFRVPPVNVIHRPLYALDRTVRAAFGEILRILWYTPLFQSRLERHAQGLRVWGGIPLIVGDLKLSFGRDCGISGQTTLLGRSAGERCPTLIVGDKCQIGWHNQIAVGTRVVLGNHVLMAANCSLLGYPGHPIDPIARAEGKSDTDDQIGDIVIEDNVWLATGVTVLAGVRIGRDTVVAAGSIVTRDLPPGVIAGGIPARPIKTLEEAGARRS